MHKLYESTAKARIRIKTKEKKETICSLLCGCPGYKILFVGALNDEGKNGRDLIEFEG